LSCSVNAKKVREGDVRYREEDRKKKTDSEKKRDCFPNTKRKKNDVLRRRQMRAQHFWVLNNEDYTPLMGIQGQATQNDSGESHKKNCAEENDAAKGRHL